MASASPGVSFQQLQDGCAEATHGDELKLLLEGFASWCKTRPAGLRNVSKADVVAIAMGTRGRDQTLWTRDVAVAFQHAMLAYTANSGAVLLSAALSGESMSGGGGGGSGAGGGAGATAAAAATATATATAQPSVAPPPDTVSSSKTVEVAYNDKAGCQTWPAKPYVSIDLKANVSSIQVSATGADQGWGNTGHSKLCLLLTDAKGAHKKVYNISAVNHGWQTKTAQLSAKDDIVMAAQPGDRLLLMVVSAPYGGFQCKCKSGSLKVEYCGSAVAETGGGAGGGAGAAASTTVRKKGAPKPDMVSSSKTVSVCHRDKAGCQGWPAKPYLSIDLKANVASIQVSATGADQGWGNTGHSKLCLLLTDAKGAHKKVYNISAVNHGWQTKTASLSAKDDIVMAAQPGDRLLLMVVSAPYGGFECKCKSGSLKVEYCGSAVAETGGGAGGGAGTAASSPTPTAPPPSVPPPDTVKKSRTVHVIWSDKAKCQGWPAKPYVSVDLKAHVASIQVSATGMDHGWGNLTGRSKLCLLLTDAKHVHKKVYTISTVNHHWDTKTATLSAKDAIVAAAQPGDRLSLMVVSAPHRQFACECKSGSLQVTYSAPPVGETGGGAGGGAGAAAASATVSKKGGHQDDAAKSSKTVQVAYNDAIGCQGWPAKPYVSIDLKGNLSSLQVSATGADQGWGNTGHSKLCLLLTDAKGGHKQDYTISTVKHGWQTKTAKLSAAKHAIVAAAQPGDRLSLMVVSAPYGGFQCKCKSGSLMVQYG